MSAALLPLLPRDRDSRVAVRRDDSEQIGEVFERLRGLEDRTTRAEEKQGKHEEICAIRYSGINVSLDRIQYWGVRIGLALAGIQLLGGHAMVKVIAEKLGIHLP